MNPTTDIYAPRRAQERIRLAREAQESSEARRVRHGRFSGPFYAEVEEVLHAAGCVEVRCSYGGRPGIVRVDAEGMAHPVKRPRILRDDEVCEILQLAERVLRETRLYRAEVAWNRDPPVLYVATIPVQVGFGL